MVLKCIIAIAGVVVATITTRRIALKLWALVLLREMWNYAVAAATLEAKKKELAEASGEGQHVSKNRPADRRQVP